MTRRRKVHRREPYAWLEKLVGDTAVFLVGSRTERATSYRVTVGLTALGDPFSHCPCTAGQHGALCFHKRRALASYVARRDPVAKKGRAPVVA